MTNSDLISPVLKPYATNHERLAIAPQHHNLLHQQSRRRVYCQIIELSLLLRIVVDLRPAITLHMDTVRCIPLHTTISGGDFAEHLEKTTGPVLSRGSRPFVGRGSQFLLHVDLARIVVHAAQGVGCGLVHDSELFLAEEKIMLQCNEVISGGSYYFGDWCSVGR
mmetsp:Transcript_32119/g.67950  ORF Transcript_32119/g.67950 Transcript_32119/m.67950 type:complete len:165 (+) Transcript_32119:261-755(+)